MLECLEEARRLYWLGVGTGVLAILGSAVVSWLLGKVIGFGMGSDQDAAIARRRDREGLDQ